MKNNIAKKTKKSRLTQFELNLPILLIATPGLAALILFRYLPMFGLILPFKDYKYSLGLFGSPWCGFKNFEFLLKSNDALNATINTLAYNAVFIVVGTVVGIIIALLLNELTSKFVKTYHTILYIPHFVSMVVVAYMVKALLDKDAGVFNHILTAMGKEPISWYTNAKYWPVILVVTSIWKNLGQGAVMYYAALIGISPDYYEAAKIDGANKMQCIWYISLPMIKNVVIVLFILSIGKVMHADFGLFYNVPLDSSLLYPATDVLDTYVYRALMNLGDIGMSSAAAFYQAVIGFFLVVFTNIICKKADPESGLF